MTDDKSSHRDRVHSRERLGGLLQQKEQDAEEVSGNAFGYLRGIKDRSNSLELRFRDNNSVWFPYGLMGQCRFDPSEGLLLKFTGDLVYLILIKGSNLALPLVAESQMNLISGLQRHRVVWIREMDTEDIRKIGESGPTIDSIQLAEMESHTEQVKWLKETAPGLVR